MHPVAKRVLECLIAAEEPLGCEEIATLTSLATATVSKTLKQLTEQDMIVWDDGLCLPNEDARAAISDEGNDKLLDDSYSSL